MAIFSDLPNELLEQVYYHLRSIEDVHSLGRACRATYNVMERQTTYMNIMRSVIGNAPQHRFDIKLSRMLDLHGDIVRHFQHGGTSIAPTQRNPNGPITHNQFEAKLVESVTFQCPQGPCSHCLPDALIHEILARYQGLQILQDQWLLRPLQDRDLLTPDNTLDANKFIRQFKLVITGDDDLLEQQIAGLSLEETMDFSFDVHHKSRFHAAITAVWLFNEIRWVLTHFAWPNQGFAVQIGLLKQCKDRIDRLTETPLLDQLDRYAVFQFMYHHLLPLHARFLADRDSSNLPLTFPSRLEENPTDCARLLQAFLAAGQTYLQPPDIIELTIRSRLSRKDPYPHLTPPPSTTTWIHPSPVGNVPPATDYSGARGRSIRRYTNQQLGIIQHSAIHPPRHSLINIVHGLFGVPSTTGNNLYEIQDLSAKYFSDRALVEFEKYEKKSGRYVAERYRAEGKNVVDIRWVFKKQWGETWWNVWWWAGSEDKARAKMERWREYGLDEDVKKDMTWW